MNTLNAIHSKESEESRKIPWVNWDLVCKPREEGGLGVKILHIFNLALLGKWRWRVLFEGRGLWFKGLKVRYGAGSVFREAGGQDSAWWRDLGRLDGSNSPKEGWLSKGVVRKLGNGRDILFWNEIWVGEEKLSITFKRLYNMTTTKDATIFDMSVWRDGSWNWKLHWRRDLFIWEQGLMESLLNILHNTQVQHDGCDSWVWLGDTSGIFSVHSAYRIITENASMVDNRLYKALWNKDTPLRVAAFSWKALLDRIPTASNLQKRGVNFTSLNPNYSFCNSALDETAHTLLHCPLSYGMWMLIYNWIGVDVVIPADLKSHHFLQHEGLLHNRISKSCWQLVWFSVVWSLWLLRNEIIFKGCGADYVKLFDLTRIRAWNWCFF